MEELVSIIIPTCNRKLEFARLVSFLCAANHQIPIIVLDGSDDESGEQNRIFSESFSNVSYSKFDRSIHLGVRITEGIRSITTPFVVICGDDDFVFPESIIECANFLKNNPDYSSASGRVWSMRYFLSKPLFKKGLALGNELNFGGSINHEKFIQRVLFYFAYTAIGYVPLTYAVLRKEMALETYELTTDKIRYTSIELFTNTLFLMNGKLAKLPIAFGIRDYSSITIRDPMREGDNSYIPIEDIEYMRPILIDALLKFEDLPPQVAAYAVDSLLTLYLDERKNFGEMKDSNFISRVRMLYIWFQCIVSRINPILGAKMTGMPENIYRQLLDVHNAFISSRGNS